MDRPEDNAIPPGRIPWREQPPSDEGPDLRPYPGDGAVDHLHDHGSLGLPHGWVRTLANASAVVVIALAFWFLLSDLVSAAREQRDTIRDLGHRFERVGTQTEQSIRELRDGVKALDATMRQVVRKIEEHFP